MRSLDKDYPFLTEYFTKGIKNSDRNIAHCILFWGNDIDAQYELALEISRILNCKSDANTDCECLNCNWIRSNTHPAVLTYSKYDNKSSGDETKNVISIEQARNIKNDLAITNGYHRVLIFCDKDENGNLGGLNQVNFPADTSNALLKTFEEPPQNTTFFFLTKDISDVISTVVSRCQCFFVPSKQDESQNFELVKDFMENYLDTKRDDVLEFNNRMLSLLNDNDPSLIFTQMQNYLLNLMKSNLDNRHLKIKLLHDINSIEKAKRECKLNMNIQTVSENLAFDLIL